MSEPRLGLSEGAGSNPRSQHHIICGHQPVYLPGIILLNKIAQVDACVFVGHCKFEPGTWQQRNYIRTSHGRTLLTVPVRKGPSINETQPLPHAIWRDDHIRAIKYNYRDRPFFNDYFPEIEAAIRMPCQSLSDLNIGLIHILMHMLDIHTPTYRSEDLGFKNYREHHEQPRKTQLLAELCARLGAKHYLSSPGEIAYVDKRLMNGYEHSFQEFEHPVYGQSRANTYFVPDLSVIDLLFNVGPDAGRIVKEARRV